MSSAATDENQQEYKTSEQPCRSWPGTLALPSTERLVQAPKQTIENEICLHFPRTLEIRMHEEKLNELHVVLPINIETCAE